MTASHPGNHGDLRDASTAELVKRLAEETSRLVRQEVELARAELTDKGRVAGQGAGMFGAAGAIALVALGALTACLIALLATAIDHVWLSALIVGAVEAAIAGVLAMQGRNRIRQAAPAAPEQTIESVKEDMQWARNRTRSAAR